MERGEKERRQTALFYAMGVALIVLTLCVMVEATFALMTTRTASLDNPLAIGNTGITAEETFDGWNAKQVRLRVPTGAAYVKSMVRAMIVPYIYDSGGNLIASDLGGMAAPTGNQMTLGDVIFEFDSAWSANWFYQDGFFYYRTVLEPVSGLNQTALLLRKVSLTAAGRAKYGAGAQIKVEVIADSLQAEGESWREWDVTVSDGTVSP
ncbi:MAG: hypothetical protein LBG83_00565 [Oscillospiraceae bacterium]|jgi:hypothetical protein|nr:hypothetical protein [Oscillospiraceae bacterium]